MFVEEKGRKQLMHRTDLSADENSPNKGRSWVSKSCNVNRPNLNHDEGENLRNGLNHPNPTRQAFGFRLAEPEFDSNNPDRARIVLTTP
jgi:hypothetical protein